MFKTVESILTAMKQTRPLVLNLTNHVTMDFIANGLLSIGASPVMSEAIHDIEELLPIASSVVINMGTLDDAFIQRAEQTCRMANALNKPIILDPVGAGATTYRTKACQHLINAFDIAIVRGNASEIMALAGFTANTKGVDSTAQTQNAIDAALTLARKTTVVISGETDIIVHGREHHTLHCGSAMMPLVVGTGCLLSAVVGAFRAIEPDSRIAAQAATLFYGIAGEIAARTAKTPGTYKTAFLDALYHLPQEADYAER